MHAFRSEGLRHIVGQNIVMAVKVFLRVIEDSVATIILRHGYSIKH